MLGWINRLKAKIAARKAKKHHDKIISDYRSFATGFGDGLSYAYLGEPSVQAHNGKWLNLEECLDYLDQLEEAYAALGYRVLSIDDWIDHGGYNRSIDAVWLVKRAEDEKPVFTRDRIRAKREADESGS